jgi:hypothetical protein
LPTFGDRFCPGAEQFSLGVIFLNIMIVKAVECDIHIPLSIDCNPYRPWSISYCPGQDWITIR